MRKYIIKGKREYSDILNFAKDNGLLVKKLTTIGQPWDHRIVIQVTFNEWVTFDKFEKYFKHLTVYRGAYV